MEEYLIIARKLSKKYGKISAPFLQRKLKVSSEVAQKIIETMQKKKKALK